MREVGTEKPWGRDAARGAAADSGGPVPWTLPLHERDVRAATSLGCRHRVPAGHRDPHRDAGERADGTALRLPPPARRRGPGLARYRLAGTLIKGQPLGGTDEEWVVIEQVDQAVGAGRAADPAATAPDAPVFGRFSFEVRYPWFRAWVNGPAGQRLGLAPIPDGTVTLRMLRRTLARELAYRPGGLLAAKIHLKHVSVGDHRGLRRPARRRPGQAPRRDRRARGRTKPQLCRSPSSATTRDGVMPAGPGGRELTAFFASVDGDLTGHAGTRRTSRQRPARAQPARPSAPQRLHLGPANYCWFTDPSRALCLKLAGTPGAGTAPARDVRLRALPAGHPPPPPPRVWADTPSPPAPCSSARSAGPARPNGPACRPNSTAPSASSTPSTPPPSGTTRPEASDHADQPPTTSGSQRPNSASAPPRTALLRRRHPARRQCDITTLARQAGISRATLYRSYPHLKDEFEHDRPPQRQAGGHPDPATPRSPGSRTEITPPLKTRCGRGPGHHRPAGLSAPSPCPAWPPSTTRSTACALPPPALATSATCAPPAPRDSPGTADHQHKAGQHP